MASLVKSEKKEASVALSPSDDPLPQLGAQINIQDVDEAFAFLEDHPRRTELRVLGFYRICKQTTLNLSTGGGQRNQA
jgi:hypothetical protein